MNKEDDSSDGSDSDDTESDVSIGYQLNNSDSCLSYLINVPVRQL
jgi:hypothetical protein